MFSILGPVVHTIDRCPTGQASPCATARHRGGRNVVPISRTTGRRRGDRGSGRGRVRPHRSPSSSRSSSASSTSASAINRYAMVNNAAREGVREASLGATESEIRAGGPQCVALRTSPARSSITVGVQEARRHDVNCTSWTNGAGVGRDRRGDGQRHAATGSRPSASWPPEPASTSSTTNKMRDRMRTGPSRAIGTRGRVSIARDRQCSSRVVIFGCGRRRDRHLERSRCERQKSARHAVDAAAHAGAFTHAR